MIMKYQIGLLNNTNSLHCKPVNPCWLGPNPKLVIIATGGISFFNCSLFSVRSLNTLCISHQVQHHGGGGGICPKEKGKREEIQEKEKMNREERRKSKNVKILGGFHISSVSKCDSFMELCPPDPHIFYSPLTIYPSASPVSHG